MTRFASVAVACVLLALTILFFRPVYPSGELGLCLPSPNSWMIPYPFSGVAGAILLFAAAYVVAYSNKLHNFIPGSHGVLPSALLLLVATNCLSTAFLSTSTLLLLVNVLCLLIAISTYEARNATREFFIIASLLSIGSMIQSAFIVYVGAYILAGIALKSFRAKEFLAYIFGLAAPYWVAVGLGLVSPFSFHLPESLGIIDTRAVQTDVFYTLIAVGAMGVLGVIMMLYVGVLLFSRNSRLRCMHITFNIIGLITVLAIVFDFDNFMAYFGTLALWMAIELSALASFYNYRRPRLMVLILLLLFLPLYVLQIVS